MALIVSSFDLCEAHLLVSMTGWGEGCASLVFDQCFCAGGQVDSNFYRTTCFGTGSQR